MQAAELSINESFVVSSCPEEAWQLLTDPVVVVSCMPGAEITEERDDGTLLGAMRVKLGPTVVSFRGEVRPTFVQSTKSGSLLAEGSDAQGRTRARATTTFQVLPGADAGSSVQLSGRVEVSGPLAPFVRTGGAHLARRLVGEFAANLSARIDEAQQRESAPDAAGSTGIEAAASTGPADASGTTGGHRQAGAAPVSAAGLLLGLLADLIRAGLRRLRTLARRIAGKKS